MHARANQIFLDGKQEIFKENLHNIPPEKGLYIYKQAPTTPP